MVFNIKPSDYRLITLVQYQGGVVMIRFFGSHEEYDKVDAQSPVRSESGALQPCLSAS